MQVAIACRHGNLRDDLREQITRKSEKLLTYFGRVSAIDVTVDFGNERVRVEILVDTEHRHNLVAADDGEDVLSAFDTAMHRMEQQIKKYKQKLQDHRRDRRSKGLVDEEPPPE